MRVFVGEGRPADRNACRPTDGGRCRWSRRGCRMGPAADTYLGGSRPAPRRRPTEAAKPCSTAATCIAAAGLVSATGMRLSMGIRASRGDIAVRGLVCTRSLAEDGLQCPAWPPACVFEAAPWPDGCMRAKPPRLLNHRLLISIGKGRQSLRRPCSENDDGPLTCNISMLRCAVLRRPTCFETVLHHAGIQPRSKPGMSQPSKILLLGRGTPTEVSAALPRA